MVLEKVTSQTFKADFDGHPNRQIVWAQEQKIAVFLNSYAENLLFSLELLWDVIEEEPHADVS